MLVRLIALLVALVLPLLVSQTAAGQGTQPRIGSPKAVVTAAWPYDPLYGARNCDGGICTYATGSVHILVNFSTAGLVTDIQLYQYTDPGQPQYWKMLLGFLPTGAHRQSCRTVKQSAGYSGPVRACMYGWQRHHILVAQWLHNNLLERGGWVDTDMSYNWLKKF